MKYIIPNGTNWGGKVMPSVFDNKQEAEKVYNAMSALARRGLCDFPDDIVEVHDSEVK